MPVQHMVNILCAVLLGPFYGVVLHSAQAFNPKSSGYRQFDGVPGSMFGGVALRTDVLENENIPLTLLAEVFGTAILGGLCVHIPLRFCLWECRQGRLRFMPMSFRF